MKVLMLNGSARKNGNTYSALSEIGKALNENGIDFEIINTGDPVRDCIGCGGCTENGCRFDDDAVNEFIKKPARRTDLFSAHLYITHIRAEEYYPFSTEPFTARRRHLRSNRQLRWLAQGAAEQPLRSML